MFLRVCLVVGAAALTLHCGKGQTPRGPGGGEVNDRPNDEPGDHSPPPRAPFDIRPVTVIGDPAPVPAELSQLSVPAINASGQVAFLADDGLFLKSASGLSLVAGYGDAAPGGGTFTEVLSFSLNDRGQIAFAAGVFGSRQSERSGLPIERGIYFFNGVSVEVVVARFDPAPDGEEFSSLWWPALNDEGQIAFTESSSSSGIFVRSRGEFARLARQGDPAPGGGVFDYFGPCSLNAGGQIAFWASLQPSGSGIFLASQGTILKVARIGDPALADGTFTQIYSGEAPALNDAGDVAFLAFTTTSAGIFLFSEGELQLLVEDGGPVPGGGTFNSVLSPSLSPGGQQIAFWAYLNPEGTGVFRYSDGKLEQVVRTGDPSPEGDAFTTSLSPRLNDAGEIVFRGYLSERIGGIYLFRNGQLARVAGGGDVLPRQPRFTGSFLQGISGSGSVLSSSTFFPGGQGLLRDARTLIARTGDPAPQGGVFTFFDYLGQSINEAGHVAFPAGVSAREVDLFLSAGGNLSRIVGSGDPAPCGGRFFSFRSSSLNNRDEVAFQGFVSFGIDGLFLFSEGHVRSLVNLGDAAPGGGVFTSFSFPILNDARQVAFLAEVSPPGHDGVYLWSEETIAPVARSGDPAPGGGVFEFPSLQFTEVSPSLNGRGQVAFTANLSTGGTGVFLFSEGSLRSIVRPGDPAPGGGSFYYADSPSINEAGKVAFNAAITGNGGVFLYSDDRLIPIVLGSYPVAGGGTFRFARSPKMNAQGQVAFQGAYADGTEGIFLATPP